MAKLPSYFWTSAKEKKQMARTRSTQSSMSGEAITAKRLIPAGLIAALVAAVANLLIYYLVPALFNFELAFPLQGPGSEIQRLPVFMVIGVTLIATIGAAVLLAVLNRFTSRPVTIFRVIAVVFLLLSFAAPFSLPVPLRVPLTLATMHAITAAIITYVLTIQARQ
jgi:hypothetical protein